MGALPPLSVQRGGSPHAERIIPLIGGRRSLDGSKSESIWGTLFFLYFLFIFAGMKFYPTYSFVAVLLVMFSFIPVKSAEGERLSAPARRMAKAGFVNVREKDPTILSV